MALPCGAATRTVTWRRQSTAAGGPRRQRRWRRARRRQDPRVTSSSSCHPAVGRQRTSGKAAVALARGRAAHQAACSTAAATGSLCGCHVEARSRRVGA